MVMAGFSRAAPIIVLAVCLVITIGIKMQTGVVGKPDEARMFRDIAARLAQQGFVPDAGTSNYFPVAVRRQGCRVLVGNGDKRANVLDVDRLEAGAAQVLVGYRGAWSPDTVPLRAQIERQLQNHVYAFGWRYPRPAVLVLGRTAACPAPRALLDGVQIWAGA
jgi:hypothetical protein